MAQQLCTGHLGFSQLPAESSEQLQGLKNMRLDSSEHDDALALGP